jgi:hypothetical protein
MGDVSNFEAAEVVESNRWKARIPYLAIGALIIVVAVIVLVVGLVIAPPKT